MWHDIIQYFSTLEKRPLERMALLVGGLLFFWIVEGAIPLVSLKYKRKKIHHAAVNFGFTVIHLVIHTFLAILIVKLSDWCRLEQFGMFIGSMPAYWLRSSSACWRSTLAAGSFTS